MRRPRGCVTNSPHSARVSSSRRSTARRAVAAAAARGRRHLCEEADARGRAHRLAPSGAHARSPGARAAVLVRGERRAGEILAAAPAEGHGAPGTVLDDAPTIACGEGALRLLKLQRAGRGPVEGDGIPARLRAARRHLLPSAPGADEWATLQADLEYDGGGLVGWQRQNNGLSVQEILEIAVERFCGSGSPCMARAAPMRAFTHSPRWRMSTCPRKCRPMLSATRSTSM